MRLSTIWGPLRRPNEMPFAAIPELIRAGVPVSAVAPMSIDADSAEGRDLCYVKDCARGLALLQLADTLKCRTYNVADGRATTNAEIVAAIETALPGTSIELAPGHDPKGPAHSTWLDISRIHTDTGYLPQFGLRAGIEDYLVWLRNGHKF